MTGVKCEKEVGVFPIFNGSDLDIKASGEIPYVNEIINGTECLLVCIMA